MSAEPAADTAAPAPSPAGGDSIAPLSPAGMSPFQRILLYFLLAAAMALSASVFWLQRDMFEIQGDDLMLMRVSQEIGEGHLSRILAPQHVHWQPLYRASRLYFDLHFPEKFEGFHDVVVAAHLLDILLLFLLCRRYLASPWAALAAASVFGWSTAGLGAFTWKAASHFVLGWPPILAAMCCLTRSHRKRGAWWIAASFLCQLIAVGIFTGAVAAVPGIALVYFLLERPRHPYRRHDRLVAAGSLAVIAFALTAWLVFVLPSIDRQHYFGGLSTSTGARSVLLEDLDNLLHAYWIQAARGLRVINERWVLAFVIPAAALLIAVRRRVNLRLLAVIAVLTALPLFVIFGVRQTFEVEYMSRYAYQGYTFWAVAVGLAVDAALFLAASRPAVKAGVMAALVFLGAWNFRGHLAESSHERAFYRRDEATTPAFWRGWAAFLDEASARHGPPAAPLAIPRLIIPGRYVWRHSGGHLHHYDLRAFLDISHPYRWPGLVAAASPPASSTHPGFDVIYGSETSAAAPLRPPETEQDRLEELALFWREAGEIRAHPGLFQAVLLPEMSPELDPVFSARFQPSLRLEPAAAAGGSFICSIPASAAGSEWMLITLEGEQPSAEVMSLRLNGRHSDQEGDPGFLLFLRNPGSWRRHWIMPSAISGWDPAREQRLEFRALGADASRCCRVARVELGSLR